MVCYRSVFAIVVLVFLWHDPMLKATSPSEADTNQEEDDHNWWKDAEEIDMTFHFKESNSVSFEESFEESFDYSENFFISNESCFWNMDCDSLSINDIPPDFIGSVPPPPLPPFLRELEEYAQGRWKEEKELGRRLITEPEMSLHSNENCSICDWALGNDTYIFLTRLSESKRALGGEMLLVLISVGILSALIGASITAFLVRCKSMKIHRKGKGFSFMIISRLKFKKNFGGKKKENSSSGEQKGVQTLQRPWPLQLYLSKYSSQVPLDNNVHNTEENFEKNTSIEDAFSNSEGIYTEIDPTCCSISEHIGASLNFSNPHSEMDDSLGQWNESSGIENDGYVPSEIDKIYRSTKVVPDSPFSISHYCSFPKENKEKEKSSENSIVESHLGHSALTLDEFAPTINCNEIALQPLHFLSRSVIPKSNNVYCFNKNVNPNPFRSNQSYLSNRIPRTDECEGSSICSSTSTLKIPVASSETFESVSDKNQAVLLERENNEDSEYIKKRPLPALPECLNSIRNDNRHDS